MEYCLVEFTLKLNLYKGSIAKLSFKSEKRLKSWEIDCDIERSSGIVGETCCSKISLLSFFSAIDWDLLWWWIFLSGLGPCGSRFSWSRWTISLSFFFFFVRNDAERLLSYVPSFLFRKSNESCFGVFNKNGSLILFGEGGTSFFFLCTHDLKQRWVDKNGGCVT